MEVQKFRSTEVQTIALNDLNYKSNVCTSVLLNFCTPKLPYFHFSILQSFNFSIIYTYLCYSKIGCVSAIKIKARCTCFYFVLHSTFTIFAPRNNYE